MAYVDVQENCSYCSGTGKVRCSNCNGSGIYNGETCSSCYASGYETCSNCYGSGKVTKSVYKDDSDTSSSYSSSDTSSSSSSSSSFAGTISQEGASALSDRAYFASQRGDYDEAIAACTEGINRVRPYLKSWGGWSIGSMCTLLINRGFAYDRRAARDQSLSDKESAISDWKQVLDIDRYNHTARKNLATCGITDYLPLPPEPAAEPIPEKNRSFAIGAAFVIGSTIGLFFTSLWLYTLISDAEFLRFSIALIAFIASGTVSYIAWAVAKKSVMIAVIALAIFGWLVLLGVIPELGATEETVGMLRL